MSEFPVLPSLVRQDDVNVFDSACYTEFTPGQAARLVSSWKRYRAGSSASAGDAE